MLRDDPASVRLLERALALTPQANDRAPVLVELANALDDDRGCRWLRRNRGRRAGARARERRPAERGARPRRGAAHDDGPLDGRGRSRLARTRRRSRSSTSSRPSATTRGWPRCCCSLGRHQPGPLRAVVGLSRARDGGRRARRRPADVPRSRPGSWAPSRSSARCPPREGIERCRALRRRFADHAGTSAVLLRHEAVLHAMQGRIDEARALHAEAVRAIDDLGSPWLSASTVFGQWLLELLAGAPERAEASARAGLALLEEMGATNQGSTAAALLAYALVEQGRHDEAHPLRRPRRGVGRARRHRLAGSAARRPRTRPRGARRARARRGGRARSGATLRALRRHLPSAATRSSTSPPCWTAPAASATRPRRSETPSPSTSARATWSPPPAPTQVWSDWDTGQQSPTRSRRRELYRAFPTLASATQSASATTAPRLGGRPGVLPPAVLRHAREDPGCRLEAR